MTSLKKKLWIGSLILSIALLTGSFVATDILSILNGFSQNYSPVAKLLCSLLSLVIVFSTGRDAISRSDLVMLKFAFLFCFVGDIFVTTYNYWNRSFPIFVMGGVSFIISVSIFTLRHGRFFAFLRERFIQRLLLGLLFFLPLAGMIVVFFRELVQTNLLILTVVYGSIVILSLWTGVAASLYSLFPFPNSIFITLGMIFFFLMELTGQFYNLKVPYLTEAGFVLSWVFYVPSLVLISLSGYNYESCK